jgi:hypothetical protein
MLMPMVTNLPRHLEKPMLKPIQTEKVRPNRLPRLPKDWRKDLGWQMRMPTVIKIRWRKQKEKVMRLQMEISRHLRKVKSIG